MLLPALRGLVFMPRLGQAARLRDGLPVDGEGDAHRWAFQVCTLNIREIVCLKQRRRPRRAPDFAQQRASGRARGSAARPVGVDARRWLRHIPWEAGRIGRGRGGDRRTGIMTNWTMRDLEYWDDRVQRGRGRDRARLLPAGVRGLRPEQHAGLHGLSRHALALPALELRQGVRADQDHVRPWRLRPALRDGDQQQPCPRLPDARQFPVPADPDHRPRLRPQRLLQEQLHLHLGHQRQGDDRLVQGARRPGARATSRTRRSAPTRSRSSWTPRTRSRSAARATSRSRS